MKWADEEEHAQQRLERLEEQIEEIQGEIQALRKEIAEWKEGYMPFPKNDDELKEQGYEFLDIAYCRGCGANIEWWSTPKGSRIPLNSSTKEAHWSTCPKAEEFRRVRK